MANAQDITAPLATAAQHAAAAADRLSARIAPAPEAITEQWSALEADPQTSFHQSRAWVEAWTKTTGANLNVVSLEHNGVPFAILPLEIEQRGGLSIARFAGTAHSNENTGLIDTKQLAKIGPVSVATRAASESEFSAAAVPGFRRSAGTDQSQAPKEEVPAVRTASRSHWRIPPYHRRR
jgi:CelD/BcsL family acetyltransferase involved in cellulose biosynthesis